MQNKLQTYVQMLEHTATQITRSHQSWTSFLITAARLYKYSYPEQLMIYAQRPDATACAEYDQWNQIMRRWVKRGSKGIALIDASGDKLRLRYVFDVADTAGRENSRNPFQWKLKPEHEAPILKMLKNSYDINSSTGLVENLQNIAVQLANEYFTDNHRDILYTIDGSFLEGYDEFNLGIVFREAATVSISYMLLSRCGMKPEDYLDQEDFSKVFNFNTTVTVTALGKAVSEVSRRVLRQIEVGIKNYELERGKENERIGLQQEREYLIPDLTIPEQDQPISKYGRMRKNYLEKHRPIIYNSLLIQGKLYPHLLEIDQTANRRLEQLMKDLLVKQPAPDKATAQMAWVGHMNNLKAQAEEMIFAELIYN
ncbi:MAG: TnpV protein [Desulfosporosinus sp.]|nr:TnpV protein [Desulfosporosinus sp.]